MSKIIFHIEDRGNLFIFHWFFYMICGFKYILETNPSSGNDGGGSIQQNIDKYDNNNLKLPYYIYFSYIENFLDYQKESLEIIKNDFKVISKDEITTDDIIINNYGESNTKEINYSFIKELFLSNIDKTLLNKNKFNYKHVYIRRNKAHLCEGNKKENFIKRRHILNENELCCMLSKLNIECLYLEDFNFIDKINIFSNAATIISPNSGALSMLIFANETTNVIEINTQNPHQVSQQYESICNFFKIQYKRYLNVSKIDNLDNMIINIQDFENYIK